MAPAKKKTAKKAAPKQAAKKVAKKAAGTTAAATRKTTTRAKTGGATTAAPTAAPTRASTRAATRKNSAAAADPATPKKRGRPPEDGNTPTTGGATTKSSPGKRGRPAKSSPATATPAKSRAGGRERPAKKAPASKAAPKVVQRLIIHGPKGPPPRDSPPPSDPPSSRASSPVRTPSPAPPRDPPPQQPPGPPPAKAAKKGFTFNVRLNIQSRENSKNQPPYSHPSSSAPSSPSDPSPEKKARKEGERKKSRKRKRNDWLDDWVAESLLRVGDDGPILSLREERPEMLLRRPEIERGGPGSIMPASSGYSSLGDLLRENGEDHIGGSIARHRRDVIYDDQIGCRNHLKQQGCFLEADSESRDGPDKAEKKMIGKLRASNCQIPTGTVFDRVTYNHICKAAKEKNEPYMIQLLGDLIVPQADIAIRRMHGFATEQLTDTMCEVWKHSIPLDEMSARLSYRSVQGKPSMGYRLPMPQPDHTVGFSPSAFTKDQQSRLADQLTLKDDEKAEPQKLYTDARSHAEVIMKRMYFPFLTKEVKCSMTDLKSAELQNAHNMAVAMKGVVELFRRVDPQKPKELHGRVLGFSISQNRDTVEIKAHYPMVHDPPAPKKDDQSPEKDDQNPETNDQVSENSDENKGPPEIKLKVTYHSYKIKYIKWTTESTKWDAYKFVMAVYKDWVPSHLERLRSAIDALPEGPIDQDRATEIASQEGAPENGSS